MCLTIHIITINVYIIRRQISIIIKCSKIELLNILSAIKAYTFCTEKNLLYKIINGYSFTSNQCVHETLVLFKYKIQNNIILQLNHLKRKKVKEHGSFQNKKFLHQKMLYSMKVFRIKIKRIPSSEPSVPSVEENVIEHGSFQNKKFLHQKMLQSMKVFRIKIKRIPS